MDTDTTIATITKSFTWQVADVPEIPTPENWQSFMRSTLRQAQGSTYSVDLAPNTRCPTCEGAGRVDRQRCRACGGRGEIGG